MEKTLHERLSDLYFRAKREDNYEAMDTLKEAIDALYHARMEREVPREDNKTLIGRFVSSVGYDYVQHSKKNTAQIHPDWSEDTKVLWEEIESRLQTPKCLNFDREGALAEIDDLRKMQDGILSNGGISRDSSWLVGIIHGLNDARRVIEKHITAEEAKSE